MTLVVNGAETFVSCSFGEDEDRCNSGANTDVIPAGTLVALKFLNLWGGVSNIGVWTIDWGLVCR